MAQIGKSAPFHGKSGGTDATVTIPPATAGELKVATFQKDADFVIPAGANSVRIQHNDATGGSITVNGKTIEYRDEAEYNCKENTTTSPPTLDFVPQLTVVTNGKRVEIDVEYPSTSAVDPTTI